MTKDLNSYFNIFECGRKLLDRLDGTYQRAFMATPQDKYYTKMLKNLVEMNNRNGEIFSNEKLHQEVSDVREETDAEHERNIKKSYAILHFSLLYKRKMYQQSTILYIMSWMSR